MAFILRGLEVGAGMSTLSFLVGLATLTWLPDELHIWESFPIPRVLVIVIIPLVAFAFSLFLALLTSCDPRLASQSTASGAAIASVIALPCIFSFPFEILIIWSALTYHPVSTTPVTLLACLLNFALAAVFKYVEPNYVVGIRDLWTLRNTHVWEETHFFAFQAFGVTGIVGIVLTFFVPAGLWQILLIAGLFFIPTALSVLYSYLIREEAQYIVR